MYSAYNNLLDAGWRMGDIDNMDLLGYWKVRAWKARNDKKEKEPVAKRAYIDEAWLSLG